MAIAYLEMKIVSRGHTTQNRNCVGASAYNSREKLYSTDNGHTYNYSFKSADVENKNILLPANAPQEFKNRQTLWQAVEQVETSNKAQLARKIILALPKETTAEQRKELVENYCNTAFVKEGMCVDYAIHRPDKGNENYHCHIMLTMRSIDKHGQWENKKSKIYVLDKDGNKIPIIDKETGKQKIGDKGRLMFKTQTIKTNDWDNPKNLEKWRNLAEQEINKYLPAEKQISMKSYERQGLDKLAQVHEGYSQNSEKKEYNENAKIINSVSQDIDNEQKIWKAVKIKIQNEKITENENNRLSNSPTDGRKDAGTMSDTPEKQTEQPKPELKIKPANEKPATAHEQQQPEKSEARLKLEKQKEQIEKQLAEQQKIQDQRIEKMDEKTEKWIAEMDRKTREMRERYKVSDRRQPNLPAQQQQKTVSPDIQKEIEEREARAKAKLEEYQKKTEKQLAELEAEQKPEQQKTETEKAKETLENLKKPKAKLVKSEWQKQRDKERENSRGISR